MTSHKYIIGIDLGTTNCTMAYAANDQEGGSDPQIVQFLIPQIVQNSLQGEVNSLPSFLYFPIEGEAAAGSVAVDWDAERKFCVGSYARERGSEVAHRLIASSKSWLCHDGIKRRGKILPLDGDESSQMSPIEVCSEFLKHLREVWDISYSEDPFTEQTILVTVPASFDPSARQLVQEAAVMAGYPEIILLEEPQAAFYAWLYSKGENWRQELNVGDSILVVDIGGGTTDFSLIAAQDNQGDLELERTAVGAHLLLGGDNMDLSLAYLAKGKLEDEGHEIDEWQLQGLIHGCRNAKEKLLGFEAPEFWEVTIQGRGTGLIGGSLTVTITREEAQQFLIEGFVPLVGSDERSLSEKRGGMQTVGLPYASDARISCQLAKFLSMTGDSNDSRMENFVMPTAVMFNGGALKSEAIKFRIIELLNQWAEEHQRPAIKVLSNHDLDCAVSQGAAYYGLARMGKGIRIKGGTSRSYFIGVEESIPAVPGMPKPLKAVCVVPHGMEEGSQASLEDERFSLLLGEQAQFRFFSRDVPKLSNGQEPDIGYSLRNWKRELTELHPIETVLEKNEDDGKTVSVTLHSKVTELGVLELWCSADDGRKWKLEFDLRQPLEEKVVN
ncbi:MAG: Hsp70 family protein [Chlamydiota bacterium]